MLTNYIKQKCEENSFFKLAYKTFLSGFVGGVIPLMVLQSCDKKPVANQKPNLEMRVERVEGVESGKVKDVNKVESDVKPKIKKKIIVLDPGHGMSNRKQGVYDPGTVFEDFYESKIVLNQVNKIKNILQDKGYEVILTRIDDSEGINYKQRIKFAKEKNADIFVSLHCNAVNSDSVYGQEVFYKNENSKKLANSIQSSLVSNIDKKFKTRDRGVKKRDLGVFESDIPSVLIESGFLTNKNDRTYLTDNINDVELGISKGIENYFKKD